MVDQGTLFGPIGPAPPPVPRGFRYREDILTVEEQIAVVASLAQLDLKPFEFHGHIGNRRVASFGLQYDFERQTLEAAREMPAFLHDLLQRAAQFAGCAPNLIRQVGVNEYRPGAGIGWHKDKAQFGTVIGVSLLAPATMRFRRQHAAGWQRFSKLLAPRSVYLLSEEIRDHWQHSILPVNELRYSINFRTLA